MSRSLILSACLGACILCSTTKTSAQSLYTPRNIEEAFVKGTRSLDGKPGPAYWQNKGRYRITVSVLPPDRNIRGSEQISYTNNSPDTLRSLVFRIVLNMHRPGAQRYGEAGANYLTQGVSIDTFLVNGQNGHWDGRSGNATAQTVPLARPLLPHDSVQLDIGWHYQISLQSGREGMIDSTTYYLAYFYPRVSVYDDYNGWDRLPFTDGQEFYNDFNDYTLTVKAPRNFIVWATGALQNPNEVLQPAYAAKLAASMTSDTTIHIVTPGDLASGQITAGQPINSWTWTAGHITDIALGVSDHYNWDAGSVVVDDATGRRASVQSAYNDTASEFHRYVRWGIYSLGWYSRQWPGVAYPFPKMTAFQGYADMEYPMMINDGSTGGDTTFGRLVEDHEIAHTFFPFYMGINESRYAFMDEGWATTLELLIGRTERPVEQADDFYKKFRVTRWIHDKSTEEDLPIIIPANVLNGAAYSNNSYGKPSLGYLAMKDLLGDDLFKKCLHAYMDRWHGKHPIPWDFFNSFNDASGRNLNWFWSNWYFSNGYIDLAVRGVSPAARGHGYAVSVENIGGFDAPFNLYVTYSDGTRVVLHQSPGVWSTGEKTITVTVPQKIQSVVLDGGIFMDADISNNTWKAD
jgi:hypothetical protein